MGFIPGEAPPESGENAPRNRSSPAVETESGAKSKPLAFLLPRRVPFPSSLFPRAALPRVKSYEQAPAAPHRVKVEAEGGRAHDLDAMGRGIQWPARFDAPPMPFKETIQRSARNSRESWSKKRLPKEPLTFGVSLQKPQHHALKAKKS